MLQSCQNPETVNPKNEPSKETIENTESDAQELEDLNKLFHNTLPHLENLKTPTQFTFDNDINKPDKDVPEFNPLFFKASENGEIHVYPLKKWVINVSDICILFLVTQHYQNKEVDPDYNRMVLALHKNGTINKELLDLSISSTYKNSNAFINKKNEIIIIEHIGKKENIEIVYSTYKIENNTFVKLGYEDKRFSPYKDSKYYDNSVTYQQEIEAYLSSKYNYSNK